jgi:lipoprotein-anchoring transpeptidase ErfK/SrfK
MKPMIISHSLRIWQLMAFSAILILVLTAPAAAQLAMPAADGDRAPNPAHDPLADGRLDGASQFQTRTQKLIAGMIASGESDLDVLVAAIAADNREVLDHIVVNLATQRIYECNFQGDVLHEDKISSGRQGYDTPPGDYTVVNKAPKAYSQKYDAWMLQWMGLTADGAYGMHGLEGSSYERHLGNQASHGCIRLSRAYAKELYPRVEVGLPVSIVNDPDLKLALYEPLSRRQAVNMVLDVLAPANPGDIFY